MKEPETTDDCLYYTFRGIGEEGEAKAWVNKEKCPKCGKGLMGKPKDEKGKVKIRAKEYVCPECNHTIDKAEYEPTLKVNIKYTCPHCKAEGETQIPYIRKKVQVLDEESGKKVAKEVLRFQCEKCKQNIDISKKMK